MRRPRRARTVLAVTAMLLTGCATSAPSSQASAPPSPVPTATALPPSTATPPPAPTATSAPAPTATAEPSPEPDAAEVDAAAKEEAGGSISPERLAELVAFIETQTGQKFESTPDIQVIEAARLRAEVPIGVFVDEGLWDLLLALGLVSRSDSRLAADAVRAEQVRGRCCPIAMRLTGDRDFDDVVLVHELSHALDGPIVQGIIGAFEAVSPLQALVEGNAHRIAFVYADVLESRGADLPDPPAVFDPDGDVRLPAPVQQILEFPYDEGRVFAAALAERSGESGITKAFSRPPATSEQILNVDAYLNDERGHDVLAPEPPLGSTVRYSSTLGAFATMLLVESNLDADAALGLARTWAGDTYVLSDLDEQICISATIQFDSEADALQFAEAASFDDMTQTGSQVTFANCA